MVTTVGDVDHEDGEDNERERKRRDLRVEVDEAKGRIDMHGGGGDQGFLKWEGEGVREVERVQIGLDLMMRE